MRLSTRERFLAVIEGHVVYPPKKITVWSFISSIGKKLKRPFEMISKCDEDELENDVFY